MRDTELVLTLGRLQGITRGHGQMIEKAMTMASMNSYDFAILLSNKVTNAKSDPVTWYDRARMLDLAYGPMTRIDDLTEFANLPQCRTNAYARLRLLCTLSENTISAISKISKHYNGITVVLGSDQYKVFSRLFNDYQHEFECPVSALSAGNRYDGDDFSIGTLSATRLRDAVKCGDFRTFSQIALITGDLTALEQYDTLSRSYRALGVQLALNDMKDHV